MAISKYLKKTITTKISINKGAILFSQGDSTDYLYLLESGELNIYSKKQSVWRILPEEFVCLSAIFNYEQIYTYTVKACVKSVLIKIKKTDFFLTWNNSPELRMVMSACFCSKIKSRQKLRTENITFSPKQRVINTLIQRATNKKNNLYSCSLEDLTGSLFIKPQLTNRVLNKLQEKKIIYIKENNIKIKDLNGLKKILYLNAVLDTF